jgi:ribonuclease Z
MLVFLLFLQRIKPKKMNITLLGTGNALVTKCYNTCFVLNNDADLLLVDAGGGNGILSQLEKAHLSLGDIHHVYVTHAHTDHILGVIWAVRLFIQRHLSGKYQGVLNVWSHEKVLRILDFNLSEMLTPKQYAEIGRCVFFHEVKDRDEIDAASFHLKVFDILSTKEKQFGFTTQLGAQRLVCLGDEPYNEANRAFVEGADWLLCEAFCKYGDREKFHPYEKHHSTVKDSALLAEQLGVKNLILYHTEDKTLPSRKAEYTAEARAHFHGNIYVPEDLEVIRFEPA